MFFVVSKMISDEDIVESTNQYNEIIRMGREMYPNTAELILHSATLDWLTSSIYP